MKKFTVHLMTPYCSWEGVTAKDEKEAIAQCTMPEEFDYGCDAYTLIAIEESTDEEYGRA